MFSIQEILNVTAGRLIAGRRDARISSVSLDSRTIKPKQLFIAIKGGCFDGHDFIIQAIKRGASAILFSKGSYKKKNQVLKPSNVVSFIQVKNTQRALGALAHYHRKRFKIPIVAITGSNGKTTTKEMLSAILAARFKVLKNPGTQNNHIGVCLTILRLSKEHDLAVLEIGANHIGEIECLSWIINPTIGIITNIGPAHLEFFNDLEGVFKAKMELIKNLPKNAKLIINNDDELLRKIKKRDLQLLTFGIYQRSNFKAKIVRQTERETVFLLNSSQRIELKALGLHNVYNALGAIACARIFALSFNEIKKTLASFSAPALRMQMVNINNIKIINDCYNANPESFRWALDFLQLQSDFAKKIVVCGDMLELGSQAARLHLDLGARIAKSKVDFLITVGTLAKNIAAGALYAGMDRSSIYSFQSCRQAARCLTKCARAKDIILIKGSRAMQMENIAECFTTSSIR